MLPGDLDATGKNVAQLNERGQMRWDECFLDGTFFSAKKGGLKVGKTKRGMGSKLMVLVDGKGEDR